MHLLRNNYFNFMGSSLVSSDFILYPLVEEQQKPSLGTTHSSKHHFMCFVNVCHYE